MPMSDYIRDLRAKIGTTVLEIPTVSVLTFDGQFVATRAITIDAPCRSVWPWLAQVGVDRGGFYSYDLLDNHGRPSADV